MNRKREAELEHSRYLKKSASPQELAEAKFVVEQWTNKHCKSFISMNVVNTYSITNRRF